MDFMSAPARFYRIERPLKTNIASSPSCSALASPLRAACPPSCWASLDHTARPPSCRTRILAALIRPVAAGHFLAVCSALHSPRLVIP